MEENINCKITFFLHIPFPTWDILKILPWHTEVLHGVLDCDLVGFHVQDYVTNFVDCCTRGLRCKAETSSSGLARVEKGGRVVRVLPLPISIPFQRFEELANSAEDSDWTDTKVSLLS